MNGGIVFDMTVSLGNIISLLTFAGAAVAFFVGIRTQLVLIAMRVQSLEKAEDAKTKQIDSLVTSINQMIRFEERMTYMQKQIDAVWKRVDKPEKIDV